MPATGERGAVRRYRTCRCAAGERIKYKFMPTDTSGEGLGRRQAIRRTSMFKRLSQDDRQRLAGVSRLKSYTKGEQVFGEGDPSAGEGGPATIPFR